MQGANTDEKDSGHGCAWGGCNGSSPECHAASATTIAARGASFSRKAPAAAAQAPVIKDPAEYNAYVGAIQQKDPAAQISGLEAFMAQYPNSVMKVAALQTLMQDYQRTRESAKNHRYGRRNWLRPIPTTCARWPCSPTSTG